MAIIACGLPESVVHSTFTCAGDYCS